MKTKSHDKLTDSEIIEAFGDSLQPLLHELLKSQSKKLNKLKKNLQSIAAAAIEDCHKVIITEYALNNDLRTLIKNFNRNNRIMNRITNKQTPGKITQDDIAKAKEFPIVDMYNFEKVRKSGGRIQASCPFHQDKTPSFVIYPQNNFHCFSCQESGSAIDFFMKINSVSFIEAVKALR